MQLKTLVGVVQLNQQMHDAKGNAERIEAAIRKAHTAGCAVVVLPELATSGYMYSNFTELASVAEPSDGPTIRRWQELAKELGMVIIGGFPEKSNDAIFNSAALVDRHGTKAVYRKVHLWNREKDSLFTAGAQRPPIVETDVGNLSVIICYDLEFPEIIQDVALRGADLLCAPVTWPLYPRPEGERPTEVVRVQAAASQNRLPIACADRVGTEREQTWVGGSTIIDADGFPVTQLVHDFAGLLIGEIDITATKNKWISDHNHVHEDRQPRFYEELRKQGQYE